VVDKGIGEISCELLWEKIQAGDDVVVPAFTFYATAEAVAAIGARPGRRAGCQAVRRTAAR
jgi:hypothetical protein